MIWTWKYMKVPNGFNEYWNLASSLRTSANMRHWRKKIKLVAKGWDDKYGKLGKNAFSCFPFDMRSDLYHVHSKFSLYMT